MKIITVCLYTDDSFTASDSSPAHTLLRLVFNIDKSIKLCSLCITLFFRFLFNVQYLILYRSRIS